MPKLALLTAFGGPIELAELPLSAPAPGTAALKLRMAGICGSDLHIFRGELPLATGLSFLAHTSFPFDRLMPQPFHLSDINDAFAAADAGLVPRGALVP